MLYFRGFPAADLAGLQNRLRQLTSATWPASCSNCLCSGSVALYMFAVEVTHIMSVDSAVAYAANGDTYSCFLGMQAMGRLALLCHSSWQSEEGFTRLLMPFQILGFRHTPKSLGPCMCRPFEVQLLTLSKKVRTNHEPDLWRATPESQVSPTLSAECSTWLILWKSISGRVCNPQKRNCTTSLLSMQPFT